MTADGWRRVVLNASSDPKALDLLVQLLVEQDEARQRLRELGYGCIGRPWQGIVDDIIELGHVQG